MQKLGLALALAASSAWSQAKSPDLVLINGVVYIGNADCVGKLTCASGRAQAIAVRAGRVTAVGTNAEITKAAGSTTTVVDLHGAFVMPGFNDAHLHLANGGFSKLNVDLTGTKSLAEMKARIALRVKAAKPGEWIIGRGWDHTIWDVKETPARGDIDEVTGRLPAIFTRVDGHIAIANSAALSAARVSDETRDPQGGKIDRDREGTPTGILRETAMGLVGEKIPPPSAEQRRRAAELALQEAARWGLTSAQDNSGWEDFLVYESLQKEGKLTLRITAWLPFDATLDKLQQGRAHHPATDLLLHTGMLKGFMDGSLGSRTAALLAPYADDHANSGIPRYTQEQLDTMTAERAAAGFQIGFHAIGDRGTDMALHALEKAGRPGQRPRIEHAQVIAPAQFARFQRLGVIASMQANHLLTDMNWAESRIGPERAKTSYPWKQFLKSGVPLAFGTDFPVEPITPFRGLYAAVTRRSEDGVKSYPGETLTIDQAIAAYTTGAAYAEFAERNKGTLRPGMLADMVVLDRDLTKVKPAEILKAKVLRTIVGGKTVWLCSGADCKYGD